MWFTDENLRNYKRALKNREPYELSDEENKALLARLEAAEKCTRHSPYCNENGQSCDCGYEAWLKTKGNTIGGIPVKLDPTMPPGKWRIEKNPNPQPRYFSEEDI